jgi:hypothetical protein
VRCQQGVDRAKRTFADALFHDATQQVLIDVPVRADAPPACPSTRLRQSLRAACRARSTWRGCANA